jgi:hypothetical protein
MFLIAVTPIFILLLYTRCITEVDDVEGLAVAATKHLELLKQKDEAESSFIIEKIVGKLLSKQDTRPFTLYHCIVLCSVPAQAMLN